MRVIKLFLFAAVVLVAILLIPILWILLMFVITSILNLIAPIFPGDLFTENFKIATSLIPSTLITLGLIVFVIKLSIHHFYPNGVSIIPKERPINWNPFVKATTYIHQLYPNDKIQSERWGIEFISFSITKFQLLPFPIPFSLFIPSLVKVIESDMGYYLDYRITRRLLGILFLIFYFYANISAYNSFVGKSSSDMGFIPVMIIMGIFFLIIVFWPQGQVNVIRKNWLTQNKSKGKILNLSGIIPGNFGSPVVQNEATFGMGKQSSVKEIIFKKLIRYF